MAGFTRTPEFANLLRKGMDEYRWAALEDVLSSVKLAVETAGADPDIYQTVEDYVTNTYGED